MILLIIVFSRIIKHTMEKDVEQIVYEGTNENAPDFLKITNNACRPYDGKVKAKYESIDGGDAFNVSYVLRIPINEEEE
jgi:hypothetical protein